MEFEKAIWLLSRFKEFTTLPTKIHTNRLNKTTENKPIKREPTIGYDFERSKGATANRSS
jgi:hypothetical protein